MHQEPRGATWIARGGIRLVHGLTNSTLITYFSGMKIDPKYVFLHAFFLICLSYSFKNLSIRPKTHLFFPILHVFAPLSDVREYSAWSWKTTLITWIFGRAWYPPWHSSGPRDQEACMNFSTHKKILFIHCLLLLLFAVCESYTLHIYANDGFAWTLTHMKISTLTVFNCTLTPAHKYLYSQNLLLSLYQFLLNHFLPQKKGFRYLNKNKLTSQDYPMDHWSYVAQW